MYIANRKIRTSIDGLVQEYDEGAKIAADAYDEATFAKWLKKGTIRRSGTPAPAREEPAAQHESEEVTPGKSRASSKKS